MKPDMYFIPQALLRYAATGNVQALQKLSQEELGENQRESVGNTPLLLATLNNRLHVVKVLLDAGADAACTNDDGVDALTLSAQEGLLSITRLLLKSGNYSEGGWVAAARAINRLKPLNNSQIAERLLWEFEEHGSDYEPPTAVEIRKVCRQILYCARELVQTVARANEPGGGARLLSSHPENVSTTGNSGSMCIFSDADHKIPEGRAALIRSIITMATDARIMPASGCRTGENPDWQDMAPLMEAAPLRCLCMLKMMLDAGDDIHRRGGLKKSALMLAMHYREYASEMVRGILDAGAETETPDRDGCFPSDYAAFFAASGGCGRAMYLGKSSILRQQGEVSG